MSAVAPTIEQAQPRRSRIVAALLTLIAPGSGHVYAGHIRRGLVLFATLLATQAVTTAAAALLPPSFLAIAIYGSGSMLVLLAIYLFGIIDAARTARRPGAAPRWYVVAGIMLAVWLASFAVSEVASRMKPYFPWRAFNVPSTSMEPTVRLGEWFLGDMAYFRSHEPARGDVVIYQPPSDPDTFYIKRVLGLPGDRVQFREGRAFINGAAVNEPYVRAGDPRAVVNNTPEFVVPAGHFFAAGDNRANSLDSRTAQHGFVPVQSLVGRATEIFWSKGAGREGLWVGTPRDSQFWSDWRRHNSPIATARVS
ncbi:MAG: signal peptidase I [Pseudomonadota bacterium]